MKTTAWGWLVLLALPGCLLVQPLDDVSNGSAGSSGKTSTSSAGSAGKASGGSGSGVGGAGNHAGGSANPAGGSSSIPPGGAANGGGAGEVDLSLFTGTWTVTGGKNTTSCDDNPAKTSDVMAGGTDTFAPGTLSDLVLNPGTDCEILADVVESRKASLNDLTLDCMTTDSGLDYDLYILTYDFVVSADGKTAQANMTASILVSDGAGGLSVCDSDTTWNYKR
ncbi:MAG TPA: hypothetical protein VFK05_36980 [Polyangiaceae bacterium]|nr:hypothetical protein [Polyangiaceae bacterium]